MGDTASLMFSEVFPVKLAQLLDDCNESEKSASSSNRMRNKAGLPVSAAGKIRATEVSERDQRRRPSKRGETYSAQILHVSLSLKLISGSVE